MNTHDKYNIFFLAFLGIVALCVVYVAKARKKCQTRYYPHSDGLIIVQDQGPFRKLYFDCIEHSIQSIIERHHRYRVIFDYQKIILVLLVHAPRRDRILVVGLGAGTLSTAIRRLYPFAYIDHIEKHSLMYTIAQKEFHFQPDLKMTFYEQDALLCLRNQINKNQYNVVILDAFHADGIPSSLLSAEFYSLVRSVLSSDGVVLINTLYQSKWEKEQQKLLRAYCGAYCVTIPPLTSQEYNSILLCAKNHFPLEKNNLEQDALDCLKQINVQYHLFFQHIQRSSDDLFRI